MGYPKRLARAKSLAAGWDNYVNYLSKIDERQDKVGQGKPRVKGVPVYIKPFGFDLTAVQFVKATANNTTRQAVETLSNIYAPKTIGASDTALELVGFKPARVVRKSGIDPRGTRTSSKRTKIPYLNYGGESGSLAFGKGTTAKKEKEVFEEFKATAADNASIRFTLMSEKVPST